MQQQLAKLPSSPPILIFQWTGYGTNPGYCDSNVFWVGGWGRVMAVLLSHRK